MKLFASKPQRLLISMALSTSLLASALGTQSAFAAKMGNSHVQDLMSDYQEAQTLSNCHTVDMVYFTHTYCG